MMRFACLLALASCGFPKLASLSDGGDDGDGNGVCTESVHLTPKPIAPTFELLLDRTGSMGQNDIAPTRYAAMQSAVSAVLAAKQAQAQFGAVTFSADQTPCPPDAATFLAWSVPRALDNANAITTLLATHAVGSASTISPWITAATADFVANPPPAGSAPVLVLITDGVPVSCAGAPDVAPTVSATAAAFSQGIKLFLIALAPMASDMAFDQQMASAGTGDPNGFFTVNSEAQIETALTTVLGRAQPCKLPLARKIDVTKASSGAVTLAGNPLVFDTDWNLAASGELQLLGAACTTFQSDPTAQVDATFPCDAVLP